MEANRTKPHDRDERWILGVILACCFALVLVLAAAAAGGSFAWLRGGLGLAGLVLLGAGGGLLVAHLVLDERRPPPTQPRR